MTAILEAAFLRTVSISLDTALLIVAVALVSRIARGHIAPQRLLLLWTLVWFSLFVPGVVPCPVSLPLTVPDAAPLRPHPLEGVARVLPIYSSERPDARIHAALGPTGEPLPRSFSVLPVIWLAGLSLLALRKLVISAVWARHVRRMPCLRGPGVTPVLKAAARDIGLKRLPDLRRADGLNSPAVTGFLRPVILLPRGMEKDADAETLRYIFLHELAHIKRGDHRLNTLLNTLLIVHWFNPLLYFAVREIRTGQEHACDALVLRAAGADKAARYGHVLLDLFQSLRGQRTPLAYAPMFSGKPQLSRRIAMLSNGSLTRRPTWKSAAAFLLLLAFASLNVTLAAPEVVAEDNPHTLAIDTYPPDYPGGIFQPGDTIEIREVTGTLPTLSEGGTYTVRGAYTLASHDSATLALYATGGETQGGRNTLMIKRGKGEFTLSGHLAKRGDFHVSFYPATGGEGFGGIYFRDAQKRPAEPAPEIPIAFREATPSWSADQAKSGNAITIRKVLGSRKAFEEGGSYIIEGDYTLATQEKAQLILYATNGETESISYDAPNGIFIKKGTGTFRLAARITKAGAPHVSMYPVERGEGFFNRYVVEKDAVEIPGYLTLQE